jgi:E3 ubiquitin-protein ligase UBR4
VQFIESALTILGFLTKDIVSNSSEIVQNFAKSSFNSDQMASLLAVLLRDLDQEKSSTEIGAISTVFDDSLNRIYLDFSYEISKLVQNVLAQGYFSTQIQNFFLQQLGIDLGVAAGRWPMGLYPRTLAVLIQTLLLKPDRENIIVIILKRVLETLTEDTCNSSNPHQNYSDIPVEQAQAIVFLFHTLSLMQKKQIMIDCSRALITVSKKLKGKEIKRPHQVISLGRLLLFFDYFIRQLYEPGLNLISQIQYNIFNDDGASNNSGNLGNSESNSRLKMKLSDSMMRSTDSVGDRNMLGGLSASETMSEPPNTKPLPPARMFCDCCGVEKILEANDTSEEEEGGEGPKPKYYNLISCEPNYQENPRLDGLAMNFLMNKNESSTGTQKDAKMDYVEIIDAILKIAELPIVLTSSSQSKSTGRSSSTSSSPVSYSGSVYYVQYFLNRLILGLPPPQEYLESLKDTEVTDSLFLDSPARVFYLIIWVPRLQHRVYSSWIRDVLCKQGLVAAQAEDLAKSVTLSPRILMNILNKSIDWIEFLSSPAHNREAFNFAYFYGIEAGLFHSFANIDEISEDEELLIALIRILEASLQAVQGSILAPVMQTLKAKIEESKDARRFNEVEWKKSACHLISVSSSFLMNNPMSSIVLKHVDPDLKLQLEHCATDDFDSFPDLSGNPFKSDILPTESYLLATIEGHMSSENGSLRHILATSVKLIGGAIWGKSTRTPKIVREQLSALMMPLLLDRSVEFLGEMLGSIIDSVQSSQSLQKTDAPLNPKLVELIGRLTLRAICYPQLRAAVKETSQDAFVEESLQGLMTIMMMKENKENQSSEFADSFLSIIVSDSGSILSALLNLLMSTKNEKVLTKVCEFLSLIFNRETSEKNSKKVIDVMCKELKNLEELPERIFSTELLKQDNVVEAVCTFFSNLVSLAGKTNQEQRIVPNLLNKTLDVMKKNVDLGTKGSGEKNILNLAAFQHVLKVVIQMASLCDSEEGHCKLFRQMIEWLYDFTDDMEAQMNIAIDSCLPSVSNSNVSDEAVTKHPTLQAIMTIMEYMLDLGRALQNVASQNPSLISSGVAGKSSLSAFQLRLYEKDREPTPGTSSPPNEIEDTFDLCEDEIGADEPGEDEESAAEDSDDEGLNSKLCTYTVTLKEFMAQHWYHCHTCGMVDGVGVCSICARVCHRGHDVTYSKFGSFFCDCGARADGNCLALLRRPNLSVSETGTAPAASESNVMPLGSSSAAGGGTSYNPFLSEIANSGPPLMSFSDQTDGTGRRASSPTLASDSTKAGTTSGLGKEGSGKKEGLIRMKSSFKWEELMTAFRAYGEHLPLETIIKLKSAVNRLASLKTPIGAFIRVQDALESLRQGKDGQFDFSTRDDLMVPTLGSQEGAFENIKMTFNGDQGSLIRQLISSQVIRRTAIAGLSAPTARRHYLAMSQEKGKLTVLQLGALLLGADSGKKKLTLPKLASVTVPFTVLTMASNQLRDDVLAVCGLKVIEQR